MKSLTGLWKELAHDCASECSIRIDRDIQTVLDREEHEGDSFLTITLPSFCDDFERSLEDGKVASDLFTGFHRRGGLPVFLRGFLRLVFNEHTGIILSQPSAAAVRNIRQLTLAFKKIERECSPKRVARAVQRFEVCEMELASVEANLDPSRVSALAVQARILFGDVFDEVNRLIDDYDLDPTHGPGATADKLVGNRKYDHAAWHDRLEPYFPFGEYALPNWRWWDSWDYDSIAPEQELPVKVTLVPKTQKTPRVIAIEPTCMQYAQQGLMRALVPRLEQDRLCGPLVGFSDQEPNRDAARMGSITGELATLDLSEASDRVLNSLVEEILAPWPSLLGLVSASRSTAARLPNGNMVKLRKFASMGSAMCFPMEEIVFLAIVILGERTRPLGRGDIKNLHGRVRVYGDDIVVPVQMVQDTISSLEYFGLKVNSAKSFWNGSFRESCGGDFFQGEWVTPVRLRRDLPVGRDCTQSVVSTMETCNQLYLAGYWKAAEYLLGCLRSIGFGLTAVPVGTDAVAPVTFGRLEQSKLLWNDHLHRYEMKVHVVKDQPRKIGVSGLPALRKTLGGSFEDPSYRSHLEQSGRPLRVYTKKRRVPVEV